MALAGVAAGIGAVPGLLGDIFGGDSKEPGRLSKNKRWYAEALAGNLSALDALKYMSGKYGPNPAPIPGYCDSAGSCSGWGGDGSKVDAFVKYQAALAKLKLQGFVETAVGEFEKATDTKVIPTKTLTGAFVLTVVAVAVVAFAVAANWKGSS